MSPRPIEGKPLCSQSPLIPFLLHLTFEICRLEFDILNRRRNINCPVAQEGGTRLKSKVFSLERLYKNFVQKNFGLEKKFGLNKNFGLKRNFGLKNFGSVKIFV